MLCFSVGLKSWSETTLFLLPSYSSWGCMLLCLSWISACQAFLCFFITLRPLRLRQNHFCLILLSDPFNLHPTFAFFLWGSHNFTLHYPVRQQRKKFFFSVSFPVTALLFNSDHVNHQLEGCFWVNLVLNLSWLMQRHSVYFPGTLMNLTFYSFYPLGSVMTL